VRAKSEFQNVGFWFHRNCGSFAYNTNNRIEGFWSWVDPLPILVAEIAWPLEMLRIKGALKGGSIPREVKGLPIESGKPLTACFPSICELFGLNYHHLDVNIGKIIVPGPTLGRDYAVFEAIAAESREAGRAHCKGESSCNTLGSLPSTNFDSDSQDSPTSEEEQVDMDLSAEPRRHSIEAFGLPIVSGSLRARYVSKAEEALPEAMHSECGPICGA
jgi:hypothetical protein